MIITALFFSAILAIGIFSFFKVKTKEDYLVAGRRAGGLAVGSSLAATILGGSSTLGLAGGLAFARGLTGSWWLLVAPGGRCRPLSALLLCSGAEEKPGLHSARPYQRMVRHTGAEGCLFLDTRRLDGHCRRSG